jgi:hypothetical protein
VEVEFDPIRTPKFEGIVLMPAPFAPRGGAVVCTDNVSAVVVVLVEVVVVVVVVGVVVVVVAVVTHCGCGWVCSGCSALLPTVQGHGAGRLVGMLLRHTSRSVRCSCPPHTVPVRVLHMPHSYVYGEGEQGEGVAMLVVIGSRVEVDEVEEKVEMVASSS